MIIYKNFNEETEVDKVWYDSSNVFYSEYIKHKGQDKGDLCVTFKNGATYKYKDVDLAPTIDGMSPYLMFKIGGTEGSQGKAINKFIKPFYEFEKLENKNIEELKNEMMILQESEIKKKNNIDKTAFISGHRDLSQEDFNLFYAREIEYYEEEGYDFIIGDYHGCDIMAQNYLMDVLNISPKRVTVCTSNENPMNINPKITLIVNNLGTDEERDKYMTENSSVDIAFVYDHLKLSGTAMNILRRKKMK